MLHFYEWINDDDDDDDDDERREARVPVISLQLCWCGRRQMVLQNRETLGAPFFGMGRGWGVAGPLWTHPSPTPHAIAVPNLVTVGQALYVGVQKI